MATTVPEEWKKRFKEHPVPDLNTLDRDDMYSILAFLYESDTSSVVEGFKYFIGVFRHNGILTRDRDEYGVIQRDFSSLFLLKPTTQWNSRRVQKEFDLLVWLCNQRLETRDQKRETIVRRILEQQQQQQQPTVANLNHQNAMSK